MRKERIYLSGKITGLDEKVSKLLFKYAELEVQTVFPDFAIVNPWQITHKHDATYTDFVVRDIEELFACKAIYMLNNWTDSRGARIEHFIAKEMGLEIYYQ